MAGEAEPVPQPVAREQPQERGAEAARAEAGAPLEEVAVGGWCHWGAGVAAVVGGCPPWRAHCGAGWWAAVGEAEGEAPAAEAALPGCWPSADSFQARALCGASATRRRGSLRRTWSRSWDCALAAGASGRRPGGSEEATGNGRPLSAAGVGFSTGSWTSGHVCLT